MISWTTIHNAVVGATFISHQWHHKFHNDEMAIYVDSFGTELVPFRVDSVELDIAANAQNKGKSVR